MQLMKRREALKLGLPKYCSGSKCKSCGQVAIRWTSDWSCVECSGKRGAEFDKNNRAKRAEKARAYVRSLDKEERNRRWRESYKKSANMRAAARAKARGRFAAEVRAMPAFLTDEHRRQIAAVYELADYVSLKTGIPHEVDHIVPLRPKKVDGERLFYGLHVPWNLQVLPRSENRRKRNDTTI